MYIDKYKQADGTYEDEDGIYFENAEEFMNGILGFCGCGLPVDAAEYIMGAMQLLHNRSEMVLNMPLDEHATSEKYQANEQKLKTYFASQGAEYFMWYYLDDHDFLEHGVGVASGWLSEKGEQVLSDLKEMA